jgi:hypothetical protein
MQPLLHSCRLRSVIRDEAGAEGVSALYVYSSRATLRQAEARVMRLMQIKRPQLRAREFFSDRPYRNEHDAMVLLSRLVHAYEPPLLLKKENRPPPALKKQACERSFAGLPRYSILQPIFRVSQREVM